LLHGLSVGQHKQRRAGGGDLRGLLMDAIRLLVAGLQLTLVAELAGLVAASTRVAA